MKSISSIFDFFDKIDSILDVLIKTLRSTKELKDIIIWTEKIYKEVKKICGQVYTEPKNDIKTQKIDVEKLLQNIFLTLYDRVKLTICSFLNSYYQYKEEKRKYVN